MLVGHQYDSVETMVDAGQKSIEHLFFPPIIGRSRSASASVGRGPGVKIATRHPAEPCRRPLRSAGINPARTSELFPLPLAPLGEVRVAQDGKEPRLEIRAFLEGIEVVPRLEQRLLNEIVRALLVAAQRHAERAPCARVGAAVVIRPLDRKLLRDIWSLKGQAFAISLVIGAGVAMFIMYLSTFDSLRLTQSTY